MDSLQPSSINLSHNNQTLSNDVEMLQTDVMRFFSILCLCLMAIFALVKTLPMAPPAERPTITEPTNLKAEAQTLQIEIERMRKKLAETLNEVQAASLAAEQSSKQVKKAAKDEQEILTRLANAQQLLEKETQSLNQTRHELRIKGAKLAAIVNEIDSKQHLRTELRLKIKDETQNLKKLQAALDQANQKASQSHLPIPQTSHKPTDVETPKRSAGDGYILRFDSDAALHKLISGGRVYFYAVAGNRSWQLRLTEGQSVYIPVKNPAQIYEMETATVPNKYKAAFERQVASFDRTTVTWGVTLPPQTTSSINRLIRGQKGGDLVIMPDGKVIIN